MISPDILWLSSGELELEIEPYFGGSIASWRDGKGEIFCTTSPAARQHGDILHTGCFPLVPFSNRIANSGFCWEGEQINLRPNLAGHARPIHGIGLVSAWAIDHADDRQASLSLGHDADPRWPWCFSARQTFALDPNVLRWSISMTNEDRVRQPAGLGFHPYFSGQAAMLEFAASRVWHNGPELIPDHATPVEGSFSFATATTVSGHRIDNCYQGWDGIARIVWPANGRQLTIRSTADHAVLYIPPGEDRFCFEPVNHLNNALNLDAPGLSMPALAPGDTARLEVSLQLS